MNSNSIGDKVNEFASSAMAWIASFFITMAILQYVFNEDVGMDIVIALIKKIF